MQEGLPLLIKLLPPSMMICNKLVHFANVFFGVTTRGVHIDQTLALSCSNISKQLGTIFPVLTSDNISFLWTGHYRKYVVGEICSKMCFLGSLPRGRREEGRLTSLDGFLLANVIFNLLSSVIFLQINLFNIRTPQEFSLNPDWVLIFWSLKPAEILIFALSSSLVTRSLWGNHIHPPPALDPPLYSPSCLWD